MWNEAGALDCGGCGLFLSEEFLDEVLEHGFGSGGLDFDLGDVFAIGSVFFQGGRGTPGGEAFLGEVGEE